MISLTARRLSALAASAAIGLLCSAHPEGRPAQSRSSPRAKSSSRSASRPASN